MASSDFLLSAVGSQKSNDVACLSFGLSDRVTAFFSMRQVQELVSISSQQITPMPNMPSCVLGLLTRRSRVMWLVDLSHMLLDAPMPTNCLSYCVVVVRVPLGPQDSGALMTAVHSQALLGLAVPTTKGVIRVAPERIQPPQGNFPPMLQDCLRGSLLQDDEMLLALDAEAIATSTVIQVR